MFDINKLRAEWRAHKDFVEVSVGKGEYGFMVDIYLKGGRTYGKFICPNCIKDSNEKVKELITEKILHCSKESLSTGGIPCGCSKKRANNLSRYGIDEFIGEHIKHATCEYIIGGKPTKNKYGNLLYTYECSVCSMDKELWPYGSLVDTKSHLTSKRQPCACGGNSTNWTEAQMIIKINRVCKKEGYTFNGFIGKYIGTKTKLALICAEGHTYSTCNVNNFIYNGRRCPTCNKHGFDPKIPAHLYIQLVGDLDCKIGITNRTCIERLKQQQQINKVSQVITYEWSYPLGSQAKALETEITHMIPVGSVPRDLMPDGFTETFSKEYLPQVLTHIEKGNKALL